MSSSAARPSASGLVIEAAFLLAPIRGRPSGRDPHNFNSEAPSSTFRRVESHRSAKPRIHSSTSPRILSSDEWYKKNDQLAFKIPWASIPAVLAMNDSEARGVNALPSRGNVRR